jgi:integrase
MKRVFSDSKVTGYQLFRYQGKRANGDPVVYPSFYVRRNGKEERLETNKLKVAQAKVKKKAGEQAREFKRRASEIDVRVGRLLDLVIENYQENGHKTFADVKGKINNGLRPYFGEKIADAVDGDEIDKWIKWRRDLKLGGSKTISLTSINRELELLRRAYKLGFARRPQLVDRIPPIKKFSENNTRKGFVEPEQYKALIRELPEHLRPITCIAFHVANRRGELLNLEWADVDLNGDPPVLTLWPGETKNNDGRTLPILSGQMMDTFRALRTQRDTKWPKQKYVFVNEDGGQLLPSSIRKAWTSACTRAGLPGLLFHDLRRSAVRNLRRAGVTETVARAFSGHKTAAVFSRYNITDFNDLREAATKLGKYLEDKPAEQKPDQTSK